MVDSLRKTIWFDFDNSPHVVFFKPIIDELEKQGYLMLLTARDRFQVCELADRLRLKYIKVGRRYGKNKLIKIFCLIFRALQLGPIALREKPSIAVSHGSRSQLMVASILKIPSVLIFDYEYAKEITRPTWHIAPEVIRDSPSISSKKGYILAYPGIKEDVYVPYFKPDDSIMKELGLSGSDLIITVRPPATEAHYFNMESERLFESAMDFLSKVDNVKMVLLPRTKKQKAFVTNKYSTAVAGGRIIIPDQVVDGLNLIWHSDLVISGGGTMNREAAALGVPVYSIFRGQIGAVDDYLSRKGRLVLIENIDQLYSKVALVHWDKAYKPPNANNLALKTIVSHIVNIIEGNNPE